MSTSNKHPLLGIAGTFLGGKDAFAHKLEAEHGYTHVSTGDLVRKIAQEERGSIERPILFDVATEQRRIHGAGIFVTHALDHPRPLVITGLRTLGEAHALKAAGGFLLFVDAPLEARYQRMLNRNRDAETKLSLEEFQAANEKEWYVSDDEADFNLRDIKKMADAIIENDYGLEEFHTVALKLITQQ